MQLPSEIPVMILPGSILFPQAMLPLYIFEPRYRQMLADVLDTHRMFGVALQKPGRVREIPSTVAGVGLVRASVANRDGTSHLVLQGLARVQLDRAVRYKPYRIQKIKPLETIASDSVVVDALSAKVLELVAERLEQGFELPVHILKQLSRTEKGRATDSPMFSLKQVIQYLVSLENPDQLADLIACTLLPDPVQRQVILETSNLEARLKSLIRFLLAEIQQHRKHSKS